FGGTALDTTNLLSPDQVRGKIVVLNAAPADVVGAGRGGRGAGFGGRGGGAPRQYTESLRGAAAIAIIGAIDAAAVKAATPPREGDVFMQPVESGPPSPPLTLTIPPH